MTTQHTDEMKTDTKPVHRVPLRRNRDFLLLWSGQLISGIGTQVSQLAFPLLVICALFTFRLERTRIGRAFAALREDELAASAMGINPTRYKTLAFVLGAIIAGVTGAVYAHYLNTWNPRQGTFDFSVSILAFVLVGGSETFLGPILGGLVLTALPEVLRGLSDLPGAPAGLKDFFANGRFIIYGLLIVLSVLFFPKGLLSPALWRGGLGRFRRQPGQSEPPAATKAEAGL